jgi:hypothetical protein
MEDELYALVVSNDGRVVVLVSEDLHKITITRGKETVEEWAERWPVDSVQPCTKITQWYLSLLRPKWENNVPVFSDEDQEFLRSCGVSEPQVVLTDRERQLFREAALKVLGGGQQ